MINHKIRKAIKEDVKDILRLLIELAIFEKEPDAVKITGEELNFRFFMDYAKEKYSNIYKLD